MTDLSLRGKTNWAVFVAKNNIDVAGESHFIRYLDKKGYPNFLHMPLEQLEKFYAQMQRGDTPERFDLNEFVAKGILQEVNRCFFHPLGLALAVKADVEAGEVTRVTGLACILEDDDPEGWVFEKIDIDKANAFRQWRLGRTPDREKVLGFIIQGDFDTVDDQGLGKTDKENK